MSLGNPYIIDRPLTEGDPIAARYPLLVRVAQALRRGQPFTFIYGAARMGKTTFLRQLAHELSSECTVVEVNWLWPEGGGAEAAIQELRSKLTASLNAVLGHTEESLATGLEAAKGQRIVVLVDGLTVGDLCREAGTAFVSAWQEWLRSMPKVNFAVTVDGAPQGDLLRNAVAASLPYVVLEALTLEETEDLLLRPVRGRLNYDFEAVRRIWQVSGGQPFLVQLFGYTLFLARTGHGRVAVHDVEKAIPSVVDAAGPVMERMWQTCSPRTQVLLSVSNELRGRHGILTLRDLRDTARQQGIELTIPDIEASLSALLAGGVLRRLGADSYALCSDVFRLWLAQYKTLSQTMEQLKSQKQFLAPRSAGMSRLLRWSTLAAWLAGAALFVGVIWLWNARGAAKRSAIGTLPTATPPVMAVRTPLVVGPALGYIVYQAKDQPDADWEIWVMRGDGTDPKRLTTSPADDTCPTWSADGKSIVFVSERDGNKEIYIMKADGTQQVNLTHDSAEDWTPACSPDGTSIAFSSYRDGNWEIYVMGVDGSNPKRLTHSNGADLAPSWSPDSKRIAFSSNRDGNWEIYVMDRDGKGVQRLTADQATDFNPAWSPDGTTIAFESYRDGDMEIYWMAADGSNPSDISDDHYSNEHAPAWARSGTRLLYHSNRDGGWDIFSMKPDGTEKTNLTLSSAFEQNPKWHE